MSLMIYHPPNTYPPSVIFPYHACEELEIYYPTCMYSPTHRILWGSIFHLSNLPLSHFPLNFSSHISHVVFDHRPALA